MDITLNISSKKEWMYFWIKYVNGFDLNNHCAKSLIGKYSKFDIKRDSEYKLNECENYKYIYICGVSKPYIWENNFHLAIEKCDGSSLKIKRNGVDIIIQNAKEIEIMTGQCYDKHANGRIKAFNTCRNWRFAYQQTYKD